MLLHAGLQTFQRTWLSISYAKWPNNGPVVMNGDSQGSEMSANQPTPQHANMMLLSKNGKLW